MKPKHVLRPNILITNDDGIQSVALETLEKHLSTIANVTVIAPDRERSAVSHSLTLHHPLRVTEIDEHHFMVDGTPTDCVLLGVLEFVKVRPDLLISGINIGPNLGDDITFSGTVAAAFEGTLLGIPSFAISVTARGKADFEPAAKFAVTLAKKILKQGLPKETLLNVNVPPIPENKIKGVKIVRQGKRIYRDNIIKKTDPRGRHYYWIGGEEPLYVPEPGTDFEAIENGFISITPLQLNWTNQRIINALKGWKF